MTLRSALTCGLWFCASMGASAGEDRNAHRISLAGGLGVTAVNPPDVIDVVNSVSVAGERIPAFTPGVDFFGMLTVPLAEAWALRLDYSYQLVSYNVRGALGPADFTVGAHLPSLALLYVPVREETYLLRCGAGIGYHWGFFEERYLTVNDRWKAGGIGFLLLLEGNTALGDDLFVHLGAHLRWEAMGDLGNAAGRRPGGVAVEGTTGLVMFGAGVRLGLAYLFSH